MCDGSCWSTRDNLNCSLCYWFRLARATATAALFVAGHVISFSNPLPPYSRFCIQAASTATAICNYRRELKDGQPLVQVQIQVQAQVQGQVGNRHAWHMNDAAGGWGLKHAAQILNLFFFRGQCTSHRMMLLLLYQITDPPCFSNVVRVTNESALFHATYTCT